MNKNNKTQEQFYDEELLSKGFKKTIFVFTNEELRKMSTLDTMLQKAKIEAEVIQTMINSYFNDNCLKRVSVERTENDEYLYVMPEAKFLVYQPKVVCVSCKTKKAEFEYKGKYYCQSCANLAKAEDKTKKVSKKK